MNTSFQPQKLVWSTKTVVEITNKLIKGKLTLKTMF